MNDRDIWTVEAMEMYGGGFIKALANLARHADADNLTRIKETWSEYWDTYERVWRKKTNRYEDSSHQNN